MKLSGHEVFILSLREIEDTHPVHKDLLNWARWGLHDDTRPTLAAPAIWDLPGDPDPDRDQDVPPETIDPPVNEKRAIELDERINNPDFPTVWLRVIRVNYLPPKRRFGFCEHVLPEWQRPGAARMDPQAYLEQLRNALEELAQ